MTSLFGKLMRLAAMSLLLALSGCGGWIGADSAATAKAPAAAEVPSDEEAVKMSLRFLEDRIKRDPDDLIAHNQLASYYLRFLRETGNVEYLDLASRASRASLAVLPAEQNPAGLSALAQVEMASHQFAEARDHAKQLIRLEQRKSFPYLLLGDALIELGDYYGADRAYEKVDQLEGGGLNAETRLAKLSLLRGQTDAATRHYSNAIIFAMNQPAPSRETIAWCRWQLGEIAFSIGDYETAEKHYRDSLVTFPNYYRAVASLGRALAARGDMAGAIEQCEMAVRLLPDISFVAALGDLYKLSGRERDAQSQYALVEQIAKLGKASGSIYDRQLAIFYADHDLKVDEAFAMAGKEYETRKDIYTADALAWTALKAGRIREAQAAIKEAIKLGTRDAKIFYHAGMIYRAAGDRAQAREYLDRALKLSPGFDPLQAASARRALEEL